MYNHNKSTFAIIENYIDMLVNILAIYIAYFFVSLGIGEIPEKFSPTDPVPVILIFVTVIVGSLIYQAFNTYKTHIYVKTHLAIVAIIKANLVYFGLLAIVFFIAFDETQTFMVTWVFISALLSTIFLIFKRNLILTVMRSLHKKQYILRKVIVVGDNTASAKDFIRQVTDNPQYGMMVIGYVGNKTDPELACDKLGVFKDLDKIIDEHQPSDIVFAIDAYDKRHLIRLVNICDDKCVKVYFLPVIYGFFKSEKQLENIGSLPIINVHNTPLDNRANAFIKRVIDIVGSALLIVLTSPLMLIAAIGIRISSPGPILFKQERVGKMGVPFTMLKFRSMRVNDSSDERWTTNTDERKTKFGTFIRRTAIDELPQLFNVLMGSMSLVGPRPEIPKFVNKFKDVIPLYMIKHYVKPGMTGLAQIKGLRGDTSVEERIHTDIYYIENWSLMLDISILLKTPFKAFNRNEKYIETELKEHPELYGTPLDPELAEIHEFLLQEFGSENQDSDKISQSASVDSQNEPVEDSQSISNEDTSATVSEAQNGEAPLTNEPEQNLNDVQSSEVSAEAVAADENQSNQENAADKGEGSSDE